MGKVLYAYGKRVESKDHRKKHPCIRSAVSSHTVREEHFRKDGNGGGKNRGSSTGEKTIVPEFRQKGADDYEKIFEQMLDLGDSAGFGRRHFLLFLGGARQGLR